MNRILRYAFVAALATVSTFTFAQSKTVTISAAELQGAKGLKENVSVTKDGITLAIDKGVMDNKYAYRIYKGSTLTVSSSVGNMLKIEMECDTYGDNAYLADGFDALEGLTISENKVNATWQGDAASVAFKTSKHQVRVKSATITLKDDPTGIENVAAAADNEDAPIYNLAGQRVSKDYKGVVVRNGKKFVNR